MAKADSSAILRSNPMTLTVECAAEFEGRWLAEVPQLPGIRAYGSTRDTATERALSMAYSLLENERRVGVQCSDTADVYGRESARRTSIVVPDRAAS